MKGYKRNGECDHEITQIYHVLSMKFRYCRKCKKTLKEGYLARYFLQKDSEHVMREENA